MTTTPLVGLRERRRFRGLPQHVLAALIGATQSAYNKFEQGYVRLDVHRARTLAQHLGCSIEELL